ncbi:MAG: type II secretion system F family protein [Candidatus Bathyarchaeota archaeon]|nr:type II secretion system F family protein [Candidatus Bathyarchaeota archaeon]MDH5746916.1 type II secretion system F family protein [Candidatus Bathyarchaeota archaeon]
MPFLETLEAWSFRLFGRFSPSFLKRVVEFKDHLDRAKIKIYPETYVSLMFFIALLSLPVSIMALVILYLYLFIPIIFLVPLPAYVMIGFMLIPMSRAGERASSLEREMPFAATYVSVMASGGIAPYTSFKRLTEVELMPVMRDEAREIIKDVEIFGINPLTAIENAAKKNPLDVFKDFLSGYASTVIIGGDIRHFLERKAEDIFKTRAMRVKAAAERLGMLLETFIIVMVLMSLCFYILFSVESIFSTGMSTYSGIILYTYLFTPMLSLMFIYLAHSMQPKSPLTEMRPYKIFGVCSVIGLLLLLLLTDFMGYMKVPFFSSLQTIIDLPIAISIALFITTAPAAVLHNKLSRKKISTEQGVSSFLRDLTEVKKTGLSPEKCIESLANRDYGRFSKELRKISSEISWGSPLRKVIMDFVKRTKSWMTQIVMFLLVETIDVGGGTIGMIESLARFNNLTQEVEKEKKMAVRPYVMMPYFAAIMLVATTVMILTFTGQTLGVAETTPADNLSSLIVTFTTACIFNNYLIGLVAGKISEESISAGFKHATILVVISVVASKLLPMFISF